MNFNKDWKSYLGEEDRSRQRGIYRFYMMLGYQLNSDTGRGLDDILAEMRALPSVTIVTVATRNRKIGENNYVAGLAIKFVPSFPGVLRSPEDAKTKTIADVRKIKGVTRIFKLSAGFERVE